MKDYLNEASQMGRPIIAMTGTFLWASVWTKDKKEESKWYTSIHLCLLPGCRSNGTRLPHHDSLALTDCISQNKPFFPKLLLSRACHSSKNGKEYSALQFHAIRILTQAYTDPLIKCLVPQACGPLQMSAVSFNM